MKDIPSFSLPDYSVASASDALFHYTTATGLVGIFSAGVMWSTAYYCTNDESELLDGTGVLEPLFRSATSRMVAANDARAQVFANRGVNVFDYASGFERQIASKLLGILSPFITCFYRTASEYDFQDGLLSQWRGYGHDGGYALQFSRRKLLAAVERTNSLRGLNYQLADVEYSTDNARKTAVLKHEGAFVAAYEDFLDDLAKLHDSTNWTLRNPLAKLTGGPIEEYLDYLVQTKNAHFKEERECRLSHWQLVEQNSENLTVDYFTRGGLPIPFTKTPQSEFNALDCVDWILIGPGPRMDARFRSVVQLIRQSGLNIEVRASRIPFTRM